MEFDINEMEKQRYDAIKRKGRYIEASILIESTQNKDRSEMPVITTKLHGCNSKDISHMFVALKALLNQFIEEYPIECTIGENFMEVHHIGNISTTLKKEDQSDEN